MAKQIPSSVFAETFILSSARKVIAPFFGSLQRGRRRALSPKQVFRPNSRNNDGCRRRLRPRPPPPGSWLMSSYTAHLRFRLLTFPRRPTSQRAAISKAPLSQFLLFSVRKARSGEEDLIKRGVVGKEEGGGEASSSFSQPLGGRELCARRVNSTHPFSLLFWWVGETSSRFQWP